MQLKERCQLFCNELFLVKRFGSKHKYQYLPLCYLSLIFFVFPGPKLLFKPEILCQKRHIMERLSARVYIMQARLKRLNPSTESLLKPYFSLPHTLVRIWTPTTAARHPGPQTPCFFSTRLQNRFIAGGLLFFVLVDFLSLFPHGIYISNWMILSFIRAFVGNLFILYYIRQMQNTQRSTILYSSPESFLTPRNTSSSSCRRQPKGLSLSKDHKIQRQESPSSYIKLVKKGKKPQIVQRRQIKLILKVKEQVQENKVEKENDNIAINTGGMAAKVHMDLISSNKPLLRLDQNVNENFPIRKVVRKKYQKNDWPSIQLF